MTAYDDTLTLVIAGQSFTGWQAVRVSAGCERIPNSFDIMLTERNPDSASTIDIPAGSPCQVRIGGDLVITGYVDRWIGSLAPRSHQVQAQGRGKCEDLVDCSVTPDVINGMEIITSSLLDLATKVSAPFGITAKSLTGGNVPVAAFQGGTPLVFNANLQETPYEILEEVARYAGVLLYEGTDGNLILADVGTSSMSSGFSEGVNIQNASNSSTMDERYSEYWPMLMSTMFYGDQGIGGTTYPKAYDGDVPRFRPLVIVSEQFQVGADFTARRARWEAARRWGRSYAVHITCDSWRDSAGHLWAPNAFAPINLPSLKLATTREPWVIAHVDFIRDMDRGTVADLVLMPKEAFQPEPTIFHPLPGVDAAAGSARASGAKASDAKPAPTSAAPPAGGGAASTAVPGVQDVQTGIIGIQ